MSSDAPGPRPRQVTIGGWVVAVASAVLVVTVFDTMATLHTVDTRDRLTDALTTGALKGLGLSVDRALSVVRGALFVAGVAAVVTGILGIFVLQRHRAARVVLTVAAVPVVMTAPFAGGLLGVVIGGAAALLWTEPARDWFAGRPARPREAAPATGPSWPPTGSVDHTQDRRPAALQAPPSPSPSSQPPPMHGWGQGPSGTSRGTAYPQGSLSWPAPEQPATRAPRVGPSAVPPAVRLACLLTWVFSGLTGAMYLVVIVGLAVNRDGIVDLVRDNPSIRDAGLSDSELVGALIAVSAMVVLWCLAACVLAALTWRRHGWARVLLLVSVGVAAVVELVGLPYSVLNLAGCVAAFVLLLRAPVRAWFGSSGAGRPLPPGAENWPPPDVPPPPAHDRAQEAEPPTGKPPVW
jgi:hypothetical protein